jgi:hypothetical protein
MGEVKTKRGDIGRTPMIVVMENLIAYPTQTALREMLTVKVLL